MKRQSRPSISTRAHAQAETAVDDLQEEPRDERIIDDDDDDADELVQNLVSIAFDEPVCHLLFDREDTRQDGARRSADRVHTEAIERIVIIEHRFEPCDPDIAQYAPAKPITIDPAGRRNRTLV